MEVVLVAGWLWPLGLWEHRTNPPDGAPMVTFLGRTREGGLQFALPAVILSVLYGTALWTALRARGRVATAIALVAPVVFVATLVLMFPGGTQDIFHNIADARLLWRYGENPTLLPPSSHPEDAFFPYLFGYENLTSAYGPLWYLLAGVPAALAGDGFVANVVAQKAMMALFLAGTTLLAWWTALPAGRATAAAVTVGWCPLLLWEFAGNGHNDAVMVFFAAAALLAASRGWWPAVFPLLALSALIKFTTLLLGPVALVWLLRRRDAPRRSVLAGLALAAALVVVAYVPFWAGADTLAFLERPGMTFILSPATLLHGALVSRLTNADATRIVQLVTGAAFVALYVLALVRIRTTTAGLHAAGFDALFAYLVFASWWFWPWYASWLAPLAARQAGGRRAWVFAAFATAALLTYCYWWSDPPERSRLWFTWYALITVGVFAVPFSLWAGTLRRRPDPA
jgi:hypothetical protein